MKIFLRDKNERRYVWKANKLQVFLASLTMLTFIIPLYHSIKGFMKIRDIAWFIHPYICFRVAFMYSSMIIFDKLKILK